MTTPPLYTHDEHCLVLTLFIDDHLVNTHTLWPGESLQIGSAVRGNTISLPTSHLPRHHTLIRFEHPQHPDTSGFHVHAPPGAELIGLDHDDTTHAIPKHASLDVIISPTARLTLRAQPSAAHLRADLLDHDAVPRWIKPRQSLRPTPSVTAAIVLCCALQLVAAVTWSNRPTEALSPASHAAAASFTQDLANLQAASSPQADDDVSPPPTTSKTYSCEKVASTRQPSGFEVVCKYRQNPRP